MLRGGCNMASLQASTACRKTSPRSIHAWPGKHGRGRVVLRGERPKTSCPRAHSRDANNSLHGTLSDGRVAFQRVSAAARSRSNVCSAS